MAVGEVTPRDIFRVLWMEFRVSLVVGVSLSAVNFLRLMIFYPGQTMPESLIDPKSTLTGETPVMKDVANWYFRLTDFGGLLTKYTEFLRSQPNVRPIIPNTIAEFLKAPEVYIKNEFRASFDALAGRIPAHRLVEEERKPSFTVVFEKLDDMNTVSGMPK